MAEERYVATTIFGLTGSPAGMQMLLQDDAASLTGAACLWCSSCSHQSCLPKGGVPQFHTLRLELITCTTACQVWPVMLWPSREEPEIPSQAHLLPTS